MIRSDEQWLATIDAFHSAALGEQSWEAALAGFAQATGSRSAQLSGHGANNSVAFNAWTNIDPALHSVHAETVSINPRIRIAARVPALRIVSDMDFITPEQIRRDVFYQEYLYPHDIPFICMTPVEKSDGAFIALTALRSHREGHISREQREIFARLAPHVRGAIRMHLALEGHETAVVMGTMEALTIPAFACDRFCRVKSLTQTAEVLVCSNRGLRLKSGQLGAHEPAAAKALGDAIEAAAVGLARVGPPAMGTVIIRGGDLTCSPLVLDVFPLPTRTSRLFFEPRVLVVARGPKGSAARRAAVLKAVYALTSAEIHIAQYLSEGQSAELIAARREVEVGTVRAQIKTIMAKVGVGRQVELVVRLTEL
jgi:DNA-binding CsgD family transcriptional regulator